MIRSGFAQCHYPFTMLHVQNQNNIDPTILNGFKKLRNISKYGKNTIGCPRPDCPYTMILDNPVSTPTQFDCPLCDAPWCGLCQREWEEGHPKTCTWDRLSDYIAGSIRIGSKPTHTSCPNCNVPVFRPSGCDHMYCTLCKRDFNFRTITKSSRGKERK